MAFGNNSKVLMPFVADSWAGDAAFSIKTSGGHTIKCALFGNSGTPLQADTSAHAAFNGSGGPWVIANEQTATGWPTGGLALTITTAGTTASVYTLAASNKSGGSGDTIADARGAFIYDDTLTTPVADQGICYLSFQGQQTVTLGTFTVAFNASGIVQVTY